ncbi:uncharacterized protein LOC110020601 [Phalaenopsis equestris]|uniref:uncharacterized protein LOC110020601 n=1 Tax=Phalaenopsis equestris TaxID=78828 RepID=UPI0009E202AF|nr:uncharacterized protein LOC110020601 [Phalaenopsis equestris]
MRRSQSTEKRRRASVLRHDLSSAGNSLAEENAHSKSRIKLLRTVHDSNYECDSAEETNSITLEFKSSYSKKASGMPIKALIDQEMSRKKPIRRSSPSLIARLMGLEALPSPEPLKPPKEVRNSSKKVLSNDFDEKITTHVNCLYQSKNEEHPEFKDVCEVEQGPKDEKQKDRIVKKGTSSLRQHKIDKIFMQQSFIDSTSRSTERMPRRSKEHFDAENLDMDIYPPFLQKVPKHLHDRTRSSSPPQAIYPSILMASKGSPTASFQSSFGSEKNESFRKLAANCYTHPSREHMCSLLKKLLEARKAERTIPLANSLDNLQYSLTNNLKFPVHEIMELCNEERAHQKLYHTAEIMGRKIKGSREISKEVTNQLKSSASERKKVSVANLNDYKKDKGPCTPSTTLNGNNFQTSLLTSNIYDSNHSLSFPTESSVTKEARKRISERWKLTNHFQEMGFSNRASSTLAEMLTLSDNETPKMTLDTPAVKKVPERKFVRQDFIEPRNHPLGISSKDGWKDDFSRSVPRSKSLPASSLIRESSQRNSRNRRGNRADRIMHKKVEGMSNWVPLDNDFMRQKNTALMNLKYVGKNDEHHSDGEENALIEREIHVSSEKLKINNDLRHLPEKQNKDIELPDECASEIKDMDDNLSVSQSNADNFSLTYRENGLERLQDYTKSEKNVILSECDEHEPAPKEPLINHVGDQLLAAHCDNSESACPESYKEADQPSPVSVLEAPFEEEEFSTGCFEKISADLQDLRMQLRLLKQESALTHTEEMEAHISSDEDTAAEPFSEHDGILQAFRDEEERDHSYVLDILIDGDILKPEPDALFTAEYPVSPNFFDKLEKKYKLLNSWSRSDRKLLFDLTNSLLADIIELKTSSQSKMVHDGLVEEVWQAVVEKMSNVDMSFGENLTALKRVDLRDDKEEIGRELENIVMDDLLDELLIEPISLY